MRSTLSTLPAHHSTAAAPSTTQTVCLVASPASEVAASHPSVAISVACAGAATGSGGPPASPSNAVRIPSTVGDSWACGASSRMMAHPQCGRSFSKQCCASPIHSGTLTGIRTRLLQRAARSRPSATAVAPRASQCDARAVASAGSGSRVVDTRPSSSERAASVEPVCSSRHTDSNSGRHRSLRPAPPPPESVGAATSRRFDAMALPSVGCALHGRPARPPSSSVSWRLTPKAAGPQLLHLEAGSPLNASPTRRLVERRGAEPAAKVLRLRSTPP
mmetsp:Transcript_17908/g.46777  ORF Transcript_17908/g.46777 Transcript_17908/m.46777 type:complete len:275 (-) Transcript_17908:362-1186(-)